MFKHGSDVVRVDFHLHTKKDKEFIYKDNENDFVSTYVEKLKSENIKVGVITNHNKFDLEEFKALRRKSRQEKILLLAGTEISVKEGANGIHCLVIFSEEWICNGEDHINSLLNALFIGIANRANENTRCTEDISGLIDKLESFNKEYFLVFAHVDGRSGLFTECNGGLIKSIWEQNPILKKKALAFQNSNSHDNYNKFCSWTGCDIARVQGSDPKNISEIGKGKKGHFKIGDLSFNALRYALKDFNNRQFKEMPQLIHAYIKKIRFEGGKFNNQEVFLSKELNTIIGIRGSGKSGILEAIRYGLDLEAESDSEYKEKLVEHIVGSGGKIILDVVNKDGKEYELYRFYNDSKYYIKYETNLIEIPIESIITNRLYFGQKDLSDRESGYEFTLLNKLIGSKTKEIDNKIIESNKAINKIINEFIEIKDLPTKIQELEKEKNGIELRVKTYKEKGVEEKLEKQKSFSNDEVQLNRIIELHQNIIDKIKRIKISDDLALLKEALKYESKYNGDVFSNILKKSKEIIDIEINIESELERVKLVKINIESEKGVFNKTKDELKEEFSEIKRLLDKDEIDADIYLKDIKELAEKKLKLEDLNEKFKKEENIRGRLLEKFLESKELKREKYNIYLREIEKINQEQNSLELKIEYSGDKEGFNKKLKEIVTGTGMRKEKIASICEEFEGFKSIFEDILLDEAINLKEIFGTEDIYKYISKLMENMEDCISFEIDDKVDILYHGKSIKRLSLGQRSSAIILFILAQKDNDIIIIDQPEDDLDNQVVYNELVKTIKDSKQEIQFIFSTHNANIPVLGDAENVVSVELDENIFKIDSGTIDSEKIQTKIIDIMEGGKEAFEKRKLIYNHWEM